MDIQKIVKFFEQLQNQNFVQWEDYFGKYDVEFSDNIAETIFQSCDCDHVVLFNNRLSKVMLLKTSDSILSIGGFQAHNRGKIEAKNRGKTLITVPTQLANDSFGTNRYSLQDNECKPSMGGIYPRKTIFDFSILLSNEIEKSLWGIGEYVGVYFSIIDYSSKYQENFEELIAWTVEQIDELSSLLNREDNRTILRRIASLLTVKCLIMRSNGNHEIGCGIDHSFARYLENKIQIPHGKAVYLGSLLTLLFYPEWEDKGISLEKLFKIGHYVGITMSDIQYLKTLDFSTLVKEASLLRPKRSFSLDQIQEGKAMRIKKAKERAYMITQIWDR